MIRACIWLLERALPADWSDHVIGDLVEQRHRGSLWILRQTLAALFLLRNRPGHGDGTVRSFINEMRLGARQLRRAPAFAIASILTLGVSIGATAAIFSVIDPVLLRPLPYPHPDRLAFIWQLTMDGSRNNLGFETIRDIAAQSKTIEHWAAIGSWQPTLGGDRAERVNGDRVSWSYFRTLGVRPMLGHDFMPEQDQPGQNGVVMLSYGLWQRRYGGDSSVVGRRIDVGGMTMTIAGVMPASFDNVVSPDAQIWRVLGYSTTQSGACRTCQHLRMVVRFRESTTPAAGAADVAHVFGNIMRAYPKVYASTGATAVRMQDEVTRQYRPALLALTGAVLLVLLIAAANVVNLQLARAVKRHDEFAVRIALGAGRSRLTRQLLAEGLVLSLLGGAAGLGLAKIALPLLTAQLPPLLPRLDAIHLDAFGFAVTAALVLLLALAMALVPGRIRDADVGSSLRSGRRLAHGAHLTRSSLVVAEVALATMLLAGAGLLARSLVHLLDVDTGFDPSHVLSLEVDAVGPRYTDNASVRAYFDRVLDVVRAVPGVASVAQTNQLPFGGNVDQYGIFDVDNPPANMEPAVSGDRYVVTGDYRSTMRIPLVSGRWFTPSEVADTMAGLVVVSRSLAAKMWPNQSALGHRVRMGGPERRARTVIGVVGDVKHSGLDASTTTGFYVPEGQWFFVDDDRIVAIRTSVDPASIANAVRAAVSSVDPGLPIINVSTMDQLIARSTAQRRLALVLFVAFATTALLLAVAGVYGVLAGNVAERTREIGLRSALGATPREILTLVMAQGARLGVIGLAIGFSGGAALVRYVRTFLFGISADDPITVSMVVGVLATVMLVACAIPALRAIRIDPSEALRGE